jgi:predicted double-glycine peptidase
MRSDSNSRNDAWHGAACLWALGALCLLALQTGCLYRGAATDVQLNAYGAEDGWTVIDSVPYVKQRDPEGCGAAVVAAVRTYWGEERIDEAVVRAESQTDERQPMRAGTLRELLRKQGYDAFLVSSELAQLSKELSEGRPVIVGTAKPYVADKVLSHYQVVIGFHPKQGVLTMDPSEGYRHYPTDGFLAEWKPTEQLAILSAPSSQQ